MTGGAGAGSRAREPTIPAPGRGPAPRGRGAILAPRLVPGRGALRAPRLGGERRCGAACRRGRALAAAGVAPVAATPIAWLIASTTAAPASAGGEQARAVGGGRRVQEAGRRQGRAAGDRERGRRQEQPAREEERSAGQGEGYQQHRGRETTVPEGGPTHHRDERADRACRNDGSQPPVLLIDRTRVGVGDDREHQRGAEAPARGGQRAERRADSEPRAGGGGLHEAHALRPRAPAHRGGCAATRADRCTGRMPEGAASTWA